MSCKYDNCVRRNALTGVSIFETGSVGAAIPFLMLSIRGRNLRDMDFFSKSDPMCVVYVKSFGQTAAWEELMRTECIQNNLNPQFTKKIKLSYCFAEQQQLKFEMYNINNMDDSDFIGQATCRLSKIVTSGVGGSVSNGITLRLTNPDYTGNCGEIIISSEELSSCKDVLELQFMGRKLDKKDFFGSSDPFLQISRSNEHGGEFMVVHRTEHINNNVNPIWKSFTIPIGLLYNGDVDRNLKFECLDYNRNGNHSYIGEFCTTARQLKQGAGPSNIYPCINIKKKTKKTTYKNSGHIHLMHCKIKKVYSFLDYVSGGTELACTFSIDFTGSNGNPHNPKSLHYLNPNGKIKGIHY